MRNVRKTYNHLPSPRETMMILDGFGGELRQVLAQLAEEVHVRTNGQSKNTLPFAEHRGKNRTQVFSYSASITSNVVGSSSSHPEHFWTCWRSKGRRVYIFYC